MSIYLVDTNVHRILKYSDALVYENEYGFFGTAQDELSHPYKVVYYEDSTGNPRIAVADNGNNRIMIRDGDTLNYVSQITSIIGDPGSGMFTPTGLVVDMSEGAPMFFILDSNGSRIVKVDELGNYQAHIAWGGMQSGITIGVDSGTPYVYAGDGGFGPTTIRKMDLNLIDQGVSYTVDAWNGGLAPNHNLGIIYAASLFGSVDQNFLDELSPVDLTQFTRNYSIWPPADFFYDVVFDGTYVIAFASLVSGGMEVKIFDPNDFSTPVNNLILSTESGYCVDSSLAYAHRMYPFAATTYTITISSDAGGSLSNEPSYEANAGEDITIYVTINEGYRNDQLIVDGVPQGVQNSWPFNNINEPHTISLQTVKVWNLTIKSASFGGTINGFGGGESSVEIVDNGSNFSFTIVTESGYRYDRLEVNGSSVGNPENYNLTNITENTVVQPFFEELVDSLPDPKHINILKKLFPVNNLEGLHEEDIKIEGNALDKASDSGDVLLDEMFPQTTSVNFIADWERITGAVPKDTDDIDVRRDRVVAKLRARGRIDKQYFIELAAAYNYTEVTIEGYKPLRCGEAQCGDVLALEEVVYVWKVRIKGVQNLEMEALFNKLKPAYTLVEFEYWS